MFPARIQFEVEQFQQVEAGQLLYRFNSQEWLELQAKIDLLLASVKQTEAKLTST